jgi:saccharopine dehydrogenase-like NADP-dependent oxidoreductase
MMVKDNIVVIGGYGQVGQTICNLLGEKFPGKVIAAGRSYNKAKAFCNTTQEKVLPLQLDITKPIDPAVMEQATVVVMCMDQQDTHIVELCAQTGTHYVDITASYPFFAQVERLNNTFAKSGSTALLSIGLAPGVTNLLALEAKKYISQNEQTDISILLGLGEAHGQAAMDWTVGGMNETFTVIEEGKSRTAASFTEGKIVDFGNRLGKRKAYRFNFSDQQVLPTTINIPTVSTRLCLDSRFITASLGVSKKLGILKLLKYRPIRSAIMAMMGLLAGGKPQFAIKVDSWGYANRDQAKQDDAVHADHTAHTAHAVHVQQYLYGLKEAEITAIVAAKVVEGVYRGGLAHGVYHIEQLFQLQEILTAIGSKVEYMIEVS